MRYYNIKYILEQWLEDIWLNIVDYYCCLKFRIEYPTAYEEYREKIAEEIAKNLNIKQSEAEAIVENYNMRKIYKIHPIYFCHYSPSHYAEDIIEMELLKNQ